MSLRAVPNSPIVDEVLVGIRPSQSAFRKGRLLPRWLLLNREVDRIMSAQHIWAGVETTQQAMKGIDTPRSQAEGENADEKDTNDAESRMCTSFAQVMSIRSARAAPVVEEVLVGGQPSPSAFGASRRLLPRWLLLNREADRAAAGTATQDARGAAPVATRDARVGDTDDDGYAAGDSDPLGQPSPTAMLELDNESLSSGSGRSAPSLFEALMGGLSARRLGQRHERKKQPKQLTNADVQAMFPNSPLAALFDEQARIGDACHMDSS